MTEAIPRSLLVLTAIVMIVAISVGVRDYLQEKRAKPPQETSSLTSGNSNIPAPDKKSASAKKTLVTVRRARMSAAADELSKTATNSVASAKPAANDEPLNTVLVQAAQRQQETFNGSSSAPNQAGSNIRPALFVITCVPLPNLIQPGDVDAPYYQNWAREYSCGM